MVVTINTDAAYHHELEIGTFAFWIASDAGKITKSGVLKGTVKDPDEAEIKAIINALFVVCKQRQKKWKAFDKIVFNTDSMNAIHVLTYDKGEIAKYRLQGLAPLRKKFYAILHSSPLFRAKLKFIHVKAHVSTDSNRRWVNQWCDDEAKKRLHYIVGKSKKGKSK